MDEETAEVEALETETTPVEVEPDPTEVTDEMRTDQSRLFTFQYREAKDGKRSTFLISLQSIDDFDTIVRINGLDTTYYEKNPIVKWDHGLDFTRGDLPIARTVDLVAKEIDGLAGLLATTEWWRDPFSTNVRDMVKEGYLSAASLGWRPKRGGVDLEEIEDRMIVVYNESKMIEWSVVAAGGNEGALVQQRSAASALSPGWAAELSNKIDRVLVAFDRVPEFRARDSHGDVGSNGEEATADSATVPSETETPSATAEGTATDVPAGPSLIKVRGSDLQAIADRATSAAVEAAINEVKRMTGRTG